MWTDALRVVKEYLPHKVRGGNNACFSCIHIMPPYLIQNSGNSKYLKFQEN